MTSAQKSKIKTCTLLIKISVWPPRGRATGRSVRHAVWGCRQCRGCISVCVGLASVSWGSFLPSTCKPLVQGWRFLAVPRSPSSLPQSLIFWNVQYVQSSFLGNTTNQYGIWLPTSLRAAGWFRTYIASFLLRTNISKWVRPPENAVRVFSP